MPTQIPISINFGTLPQTGNGYTPQQLADKLSTNAKIFSEQQFSLFSIGATAPTYNTGPWLKNGTEWYVWDTGTGAYVPQTIDNFALQYIVSASTPDHNDYQVWFKLDGGGIPQGIFVWYNGAWTDMYAALATAAYLPRVNAPARVRNTVSQLNVPANGTPTLVTLDESIIDTDGVLDVGSSKYTAPVNGVYMISVNSQVDNSTADATAMQMGYEVYKNGVQWAGVGDGSGTAVASPPGSTWNPDFTLMVPLVAGEYIQLYITVNDGTGVGVVTIVTVDMMVYMVRNT